MAAAAAASPEQLFAGPPLEERIRQRAHQLYLQRGDEPGSALADWLQAESEIMSALKQESKLKTREAAR